MNGRIHKNDATLIGRLADQAHEATVAQYNIRMKTEHPSDVIFYDMFNQKFAESIVQECLEILNEHIDESSKDPRFIALRFYREDLKEHFGVE